MLEVLIRKYCVSLIIFIDSVFPITWLTPSQGTSAVQVVLGNLFLWARSHLLNGFVTIGGMKDILRVSNEHFIVIAIISWSPDAMSMLGL